MTGTFYDIKREIFHADLEASNVLSNLREKCYKLAGERFNAGDEAGRIAAYAAADAYQAAIAAITEAERIMSSIEAKEDAMTCDGWGE